LETSTCLTNLQEFTMAEHKKLAKTVESIRNLVLQESPRSGALLVTSEDSATKPTSTPLEDGKAVSAVSRLASVSGLGSNRTANFTRRFKGSSKVPSLPPRLSVGCYVSNTYRFMTTTSSQTTVTAQNLLGCMGQVCTVTNTTAICVMQFVRIRRITMWPAASQTGGTTPHIMWTASIGNVEKDTFKDGSLPANITVDRPVTSVPPKGSLLHGNYVNGGFGNIATLSYASGTVIDVELSGLMSTVSAAVFIGVSATTQGTFFYGALDGNAGHSINPTTLPTSH